MFDVLDWFPRVGPFTIALPSAEILETSVPFAPPTVQNLSELVLLFTVDLDGFWWRWKFAVDVIAAPGRETINMKDVVDFESRREFETVVEVTDMLDDLIGAELTRTKLATRLVDSDVLGREPDPITNLECVRCFSVSFVLCLHLVAR